MSVSSRYNGSMSYEAECPCGARLQVGDHAEGKRIKCPRCGELISIPRADEPEEAIPVVSLGENPPEKGEDRNPCPYCAEMVLSHAKICPCCQSPLGTGPETPCPNCQSVNSSLITECRNCGKSMTPGTPFSPGPEPAQGPRAAIMASSGNSLSILDWILGIFLPIVGIIMGMIYLTTGRSSRGWQILGLSIIGLVISFGCHGSNALN